MVSALIRRTLVQTVVAGTLLIVPFAARAQEVGVKVGANSASLTPEEDEDPETSRRLGLVAGFWIRTPPSSRVSFQVEGLFSEKGVKVEAPGSDNSFDLRIRYFEIPLLARADFGALGSGTRVFVTGGAAPAFKLSARSKASGEGEELSSDVDEFVDAADFGLVGGLGVAFGRTVIEARYTHGLRHINTDDNGQGDRIKNRVFSVTVGFRLR
jgi:hypothetical protein